MKLFPPFQESTLISSENSSGNIYIIHVVDAATKFSIAKSTTNKSAETVAEFLIRNVFCTFGMCKQITSDEGSEFVNQILQTLSEKLNFDHKITSAYHPSCNAQI